MTMASGAQPDGFPTGDGVQVVTMPVSEHNALQARLRKLEKAEREREEAALRETGQFDRLLGVERQRATEAENERDDLRRQLHQRNAADAVASLAISRGYSPEQVGAIQRMAGLSTIELDAAGQPNAVQVEKALDGVIKQFPNLFTPSSAVPATTEPTTTQPVPAPVQPYQPYQPPQQPAASAPATPPTRTSYPAGYVSPEDYTRTPAAIRQTEEFQARVKLSEPYWKEQGVYGDIPASTFAVGQGS